MLCPYNHKKGTKVVDSRLAKDGHAVRRRRECLTCGVRFTTYEEYEVAHIIVCKRNDMREEYKQEKVREGVAKALEKRPAERHLDELVQAIEQDIFNSALKSDMISSRQIGKIVLDHLAKVDDVAYLRFASVYKSFGSAQSFRKELGRLEKRNQ